MLDLSTIIPKIEGSSVGKKIQNAIIEGLEYVNVDGEDASTLGGHSINGYIIKTDFFSDLYFDEIPIDYSLKAVVSSSLYSILTVISSDLVRINNEDIESVPIKDTLVQDIYIEGENTILEGKETLLSATVSPSNATNKHIIWKSMDETVATVNQNGIVIGIKAGKSVISANAADGSRTSGFFTLLVRSPILVTSIRAFLEDDAISTISFDSTDVLQVDYEITPENADDKTVTWHTNDPSILSINENGIVTPINSGSAYVYCTANDGSNIQSNWVQIIVASKIYPQDFTLRCVSDNFYERENTTDIDVVSDTNTKIVAEISPNDYNMQPDIYWTYYFDDDVAIENIEIDDDLSVEFIPHFKKREDTDSKHERYGKITVICQIRNAVDGNTYITKTLDIYEKYLYVTSIEIDTEKGKTIQLATGGIETVLAYVKSISPPNAYATSAEWKTSNNTLNLDVADSNGVYISSNSSSVVGTLEYLYCQSNDRLGTKSNNIEVNFYDILIESLTIGSNYTDHPSLSVLTNDIDMYVSAMNPEVVSDNSVSWYAEDSNGVSVKLGETSRVSPYATAFLSKRAYAGTVNLGENAIYCVSNDSNKTVSNSILINFLAPLLEIISNHEDDNTVAVGSNGELIFTVASVYPNYSSTSSINWRFDELNPPANASTDMLTINNGKIKANRVGEAYVYCVSSDKYAVESNKIRVSVLETVNVTSIQIKVTSPQEGTDIHIICYSTDNIRIDVVVQSIKPFSSPDKTIEWLKPSDSILMYYQYDKTDTSWTLYTNGKSGNTLVYCESNINGNIVSSNRVNIRVQIVITSIEIAAYQSSNYGSFPENLYNNTIYYLKANVLPSGAQSERLSWYSSNSDIVDITPIYNSSDNWAENALLVEPKLTGNTGTVYQVEIYSVGNNGEDNESVESNKVIVNVVDANYIESISINMDEYENGRVIISSSLTPSGIAHPNIMWSIVPNGNASYTIVSSGDQLVLDVNFVDDDDYFDVSASVSAYGYSCASDQHVMIYNPNGTAKLRVGQYYKIGYFKTSSWDEEEEKTVYIDDLTRPIYWMCAEELSNGIYAMQSSGFTWEFYATLGDYGEDPTGINEYKYLNLLSDKFKSEYGYSSDNGAGLIFDMFYNQDNFKAIEPDGGRRQSDGIYDATAPKNGLYLPSLSEFGLTPETVNIIAYQDSYSTTYMGDAQGYYWDSIVDLRNEEYGWSGGAQVCILETLWAYESYNDSYMIHYYYPPLDPNDPSSERDYDHPIVKLMHDAGGDSSIITCPIFNVDVSKCDVSADGTITIKQS